MSVDFITKENIIEAYTTNLLKNSKSFFKKIYAGKEESKSIFSKDLFEKLADINKEFFQSELGEEALTNLMDFFNVTSKNKMGIGFNILHVKKAKKRVKFFFIRVIWEEIEEHIHSYESSGYSIQRMESLKDLNEYAGATLFPVIPNLKGIEYSLEMMNYRKNVLNQLENRMVDISSSLDKYNNMLKKLFKEENEKWDYPVYTFNSLFYLKNNFDYQRKTKIDDVFFKFMGETKNVKEKLSLLENSFQRKQFLLQMNTLLEHMSILKDARKLELSDMEDISESDMEKVHKMETNYFISKTFVCFLTDLTKIDLTKCSEIEKETIEGIWLEVLNFKNCDSYFAKQILKDISNLKSLEFDDDCLVTENEISKEFKIKSAQSNCSKEDIKRWNEGYPLAQYGDEEIICDCKIFEAQIADWNDSLALKIRNRWIEEVSSFVSVKIEDGKLHIRPIGIWEGDKDAYEDLLTHLMQFDHCLESKHILWDDFQSHLKDVRTERLNNLLKSESKVKESRGLRKI